MPAAIKYDIGRENQIIRIRKFANNAIMIIWVAGFIAMLVLVAYFLFFTEYEQQADHNRNEKGQGSVIQAAEATMFTDKTTLVNIGLRMQAIKEDSDLQPNGTIRINKIIHDQKLIKASPVKPDFAVKAVPK